MTRTQTFVALDHLPDELVPAVRAAIAEWQASRPHLTDVEVIRWTAPAAGEDGMSIDNAAEWTRGLYLHGRTLTTDDVAAIRAALAIFGETRVSVTQDSRETASKAPTAVRVATLGLRIMGAEMATADVHARLHRDLEHLDPNVLERMARALADVPDADVLELLAGGDATTAAAALAMRPEVAGLIAPSEVLPRRAPQRFAAAAFSLGAALLHVEGVLERRSAPA
jgi:pyridoxal biosynthesis lyase PdxS